MSCSLRKKLWKLVHELWKLQDEEDFDFDFTVDFVNRTINVSYPVREEDK